MRTTRRRTEEYRAYDNKFTGKIGKVKVDVGPLNAADKAAIDKSMEDTQKKVASLAE